MERECSNVDGGGSANKALAGVGPATHRCLASLAATWSMPAGDIRPGSPASRRTAEAPLKVQVLEGAGCGSSAGRAPGRGLGHQPPKLSSSSTAAAGRGLHRARGRPHLRFRRLSIKPSETWTDEGDMTAARRCSARSRTRRRSRSRPHRGALPPRRTCRAAAPKARDVLRTMSGRHANPQTPTPRAAHSRRAPGLCSDTSLR